MYVQCNRLCYYISRATTSLFVVLIELMMNIDNAMDCNFRTKSNVRTILPAMQLLDGMLQKILKAKELNKICYELGPLAHCTQCDKKEPFSYIAYKSESGSKREESLQCCGCKNVFCIGKHDSEADHIIKSKVLHVLHVISYYNIF